MTQFYNEKSANFRIYIQLPAPGCDCSLLLVNKPSGDLSPGPCVRARGCRDGERPLTGNVYGKP